MFKEQSRTFCVVKFVLLACFNSSVRLLVFLTTCISDGEGVAAFTASTPGVRGAPWSAWRAPGAFVVRVGRVGLGEPARPKPNM